MFGKHNDEDFQEQDLDLPRECWYELHSNRMLCYKEKGFVLIY